MSVDIDYSEYFDYRHIIEDYQEHVNNNDFAYIETQASLDHLATMGFAAKENQLTSIERLIRKLIDSLQRRMNDDTRFNKWKERFDSAYHKVETEAKLDDDLPPVKPNMFRNDDREDRFKKTWGDTTAAPQDVSPEVAAKAFDEGFAVITDSAGSNKTQVYRIQSDGRALPYPNKVDFFDEWEHFKITIAAKDPEGRVIKSRTVSLAKYWFSEYANRRTYHHTCYDPKAEKAGYIAPPYTFNFWPGFGVKGNKASFIQYKKEVKIVLRFLSDIICCKSKTDFTYLARWIAHMRQKPWEKPEAALALIGLKGTGKSLLLEFLERLIDGDRRYCLSYRSVKDSDFTERWNDHLKHKLFFGLDEASYVAAQKILGIINDFITGKHLSVGTRFITSAMALSILRVVICANPPWSLPVTFGERRYFILAPSAEKKGHHDYYKAVADALENIKVIEGLAYIFDRINIRNFDPHNVPINDAMMINKIKALRDVDLWAVELAMDGFVDAWKIDGDAYVLKDALRRSYNEWHKARYDDKKEMTETKFGMELARLLPALNENGELMFGKNGHVVSVLDVDRQRNTTILKQRPDLAIDDDNKKWTYSYVLPSLDQFRNLLKISLMISIDFQENGG